MLSKLRPEENFFNLIKGIYEKPIANIILDSERLDTYPLKSGAGQSCLLLPLLLLEVLPRAVIQEKEKASRLER